METSRVRKSIKIVSSRVSETLPGIVVDEVPTRLVVVDAEIAAHELWNSVGGDFYEAATETVALIIERQRVPVTWWSMGSDPAFSASTKSTFIPEPPGNELEPVSFAFDVADIWKHNSTIRFQFGNFATLEVDVNGTSAK